MNRLAWNRSGAQIAHEASKAVSSARGLLDAIAKENKPSFKSVLGRYAQMENQLGTQANILGFYQYVSPNKEVRGQSEQVSEQISAFQIDAVRRPDVFKKIKRVHESGEKLPPADQRYLDKVYSDLKLAGLDLCPEDQAKLTQLEKQLNSVTIKFHANLNEDNSFLLLSKDQLEGVPSPHYEQVDGKYKVAFKVTDYDPVMRWCTRESTRKQLFVALENRCPENESLFLQALNLRRQIANLLGYKTFADQVLQTRMAKTPQNVHKFLTELVAKAKPIAKAEREHFLKIKQEFDPRATEVYAWDSAFLQNKVVERQFQVDQEKIAEYFEMDHSIKGMFGVFERLMNLKFVAEQLDESEKWHPEVELYSIYQDGEFKGHLYLDSYPRESKYGHFANFSLRQGHIDEDGAHYPASALVCNFPRAREGRPALLYHRDLVTFFHELGHGIHATLGLAKYARFSGTNVQHDFVETPSQLLENWTWDPQMLKELSRHYQSGESLPDGLLEQLVASRNANQGTFLVRQLFFGLFDYKAHTESEFDPQVQWAELRNSIIGMPSTETLRGYNQFGHLMGGYECGYYGYMWSLVYSADIWEALFAKDPLNQANGARYRDGIVARGYTEEADVLLEQLLGREPSNEAFIKSVGLV